MSRVPFCQIALQGNKKIFPPKWFHKDDMEATREVIVNVEPRKTQKGDLAAVLDLIFCGLNAV